MTKKLELVFQLKAGTLNGPFIAKVYEICDYFLLERPIIEAHGDLNAPIIILHYDYEMWAYKFGLASSRFIYELAEMLVGPHESKTTIQ